MAHTVHLPISFEFRTVRVHWAETEGRVIGLGGDYSGEWELITEVSLDGRKRNVSLAREYVPPRLWQQWITKTHTLHEGDDFDQVAVRVFSNFRPKLLVDFLRDD